MLVVPNLLFNLLSVGQLTRNSKEIIFSDTSAEIINKNKTVLASGTKVGDLYILDCADHKTSHFQANASSNIAKGVKSEENLWHRRFAHASRQSLSYLNKVARGFDCKIDSSNSDPCEHCCSGKQTQVPYSSVAGPRTKAPLELVHSDVRGPIKPCSIGGGEYFVSFVDDFSRYSTVFIMKSKSETFEKFKLFKCRVEKQSGNKIKALRTDNGGEYTSAEFNNFLSDEGIRHERTVPRTPQQNGVSERLNRTLLDKIRYMISDAKAPKGC